MGRECPPEALEGTTAGDCHNNDVYVVIFPSKIVLLSGEIIYLVICLLLFK